MSGDLVIGIGNPLRGDDGVGWRLAEPLEARRRAAVRPTLAVRMVQQLTPELVAELAGAGRVLFVDAWRAPAGAVPLLRPLAPEGAAGAGQGAGVGVFSHALAPADLLALAERLQGCAPPAWELLVPAFAFEHGSELSPSLRRALPRARALLRAWCHAGRGASMQGSADA